MIITFILAQHKRIKRTLSFIRIVKFGFDGIPLIGSLQKIMIKIKYGKAEGTMEKR